MIKALMKLGIEGVYLKIINTVYEKSIANIILIGEKLKLFPLKSEMGQGCPLSSLFIHQILGILSQSNKTGRGSKRTTNRKGRSQTLCLCSQHELIQKRLKTPPKNSSISKIPSAKEQDTKSICKNQ
jgi:hypothetical protein